MSRRMWKVVETKTRKTRMVKTKEGRGKRREENVEKQKKIKPKRERTMEVKRVAKEWEIWDEKEEAAKLETEAKKLVLEQFHRWIKVFSKKQLERMSIQKIWDHAINIKEGFVPRKGKVYLLSREER